MLLTKREIEYELDVHDCVQDPYCSLYRTCGNGAFVKIPSAEKLEELCRDLLKEK